MGRFQDLIVAGNGGDDTLVKGTLKDGEEGFVEQGLHDDLGVGAVAVGEGDVVDSNTPLPVILLQGVGLGFQLQDGLVFGRNFRLECRNFVVRLVQKTFERLHFGRECLKSS